MGNLAPLSPRHAAESFSTSEPRILGPLLWLFVNSIGRLRFLRLTPTQYSPRFTGSQKCTSLRDTNIQSRTVEDIFIIPATKDPSQTLIDGALDRRNPCLEACRYGYERPGFSWCARTRLEPRPTGSACS
jgi:hypothetical protein